MRRLIRGLLAVADLLLLPLVYPAAWALKLVRGVGVKRLPRARNALLRSGVFPIIDHYYEPQFDNRNPSPDFNVDRDLRGIDWNVAGQLAMLGRMRFAAELEDVPQDKPDALGFHFNNGTFESGDAEVWYQLIRAVKPQRIIEIGSGYSTLMAIRALRMNSSDESSYQCEHVCVEPYENAWLEEAGVSVIRERVETLELSLFSKLQENDILFIDSSHVIRPQGDVLFEFLELLPSLNKGVIVHIHDIFSPKNYLKEWLQDQVRFWNEQYLLEAFLSHNKDWAIVAALNFLHHNHYDKLKSAAPFLTADREPGSFYIQKLS